MAKKDTWADMLYYRRIEGRARDDGVSGRPHNGVDKSEVSCNWSMFNRSNLHPGFTFTLIP